MDQQKKTELRVEMAALKDRLFGDMNAEPPRLGLFQEVRNELQRMAEEDAKERAKAQNKPWDPEADPGVHLISSKYVHRPVFVLHPRWRTAARPLISELEAIAGRINAIRGQLIAAGEGEPLDLTIAPIRCVEDVAHAVFVRAATTKSNRYTKEELLKLLQDEIDELINQQPPATAGRRRQWEDKINGLSALCHRIQGHHYRYWRRALQKSAKGVTFVAWHNDGSKTRHSAHENGTVLFGQAVELDLPIDERHRKKRSDAYGEPIETFMSWGYWAVDEKRRQKEAVTFRRRNKDQPSATTVHEQIFQHLDEKGVPSADI